MMNFKTMLSLILSVASVSCSVKEDRQDCPCVMSLDLSGLDTAVIKNMNVLAVSEDGIVLKDYLQADDFSSEYVREVPHGLLEVNLWSGDEGVNAEDYLVQIPYGVECPPVYLHGFQADTRGETFTHKVSLYKNYCRLTVEMPERIQLPRSLVFKGNVDGYDIGGKPSEGEFSCVAYPSETGEYQVLIPRQYDSSLLLEVDDKTPHMKLFAIGEYLSASGYDWTAEDLADVSVVLDYSMTSVKISISGWDKEEIYSVIL